MAEANDCLAVIGDWTPNPSPRTLISNFLNENFGSKPFPDPLQENGSNGDDVHGSEDQQMVASPKEEEARQPKAQFFNNLPLQPNIFNFQKPNTNGGLSERMAARAGLNLPKLNMSRTFPTNVVSSSAEVQSPYLTIPPGLSPTTLLESPVFLSNSLGQPSPTTGKFSFLQNCNSNSMTISLPDEIEDEPLEDVPEEFAFKPPLESKPAYLSSAENTFQDSPVMNYLPISPSLEENNVHVGQDIEIPKNQSQQELNSSSPPNDNQQDGGEADPQGENSSQAVGTPAEDGYNWRKYGQKQVKHSEFPRSYYKCTHPNCSVKKKVERSHEGHITEIIYRGKHNHPKPSSSRRTGAPPSQNGNAQDWQGDVAQNRNAQDWQGDGIEATSLAAAEFGDPSDAIDVSSTLSNDDNEDEDDGATNGDVLVGQDAEEEENESKRRKLDACAFEMGGASRAVREPRVVVQTTSDVDILDDGYRWRKYGQKVVKGNPNPRSYYKCTHPGCSVRKHVERASHDLKSVITTYEGKHNHEVPAARSSGHQNSSPGSAAASPSQSHSLHRRPEPMQDGLVRFNLPLGLLSLPPRDHLGPVGSFSFGLGQSGLANLSMAAMAGLGPVAAMKVPVLLPPPPIAVHAFLGHRPTMESGFMIPKGELKEPVAGSGLPMLNGNTQSVYEQIMRRLPLGPQM
ncbi:probable WRKY transcription factor 2 isoform X3 [Ananas comosus]|nr:probable WRKY transcription factor 2 isoform X3 [Ananas comosus]XP_020083105.1 probable WRKY transcription factor 2 isoform X3 [Ananas comosus]XP_020083107.1 probable WRKY transcription factor 2 isoform X3 [Ananas comosus]